jgi:hypothetical protein
MGETSRRACARAGIAPSGKAGGSGGQDFAHGDNVKAGNAGGGGARKKKSRGWCGRRVTKEEEVCGGSGFIGNMVIWYNSHEGLIYPILSL